MKNLNFVLTFYLPKFWGIDFKNHTHFSKFWALKTLNGSQKFLNFFGTHFFAILQGFTFQNQIGYFDTEIWSN